MGLGFYEFPCRNTHARDASSRQGSHIRLDYSLRHVDQRSDERRLQHVSLFNLATLLRIQMRGERHVLRVITDPPTIPHVLTCYPVDRQGVRQGRRANYLKSGSSKGGNKWVFQKKRERERHGKCCAKSFGGRRGMKGQAGRTYSLCMAPISFSKFPETSPVARCLHTPAPPVTGELLSRRNHDRGAI